MRWTIGMAAAGLMAAAALSGVEAQASEGRPGADGDFSVELGAGVLVAPDYKGSDDYEARAIPVVEISWKDRVFLSGRRGLGVNALKTEDVTAGAALGWQFGRDEDDNDALAGMGDVDGSPTGRLFFDYAPGSFGVGLGVEQDLGDGHEGFLAEAEVYYRTRFADNRAFVKIGPKVSWGSEDYNQAFFGVSAAQAAATPYAVYQADAGVNEVSFGAAGGYGLTEHVNLGVFASLSELVGDAADSPLVDQAGSSTQLTGGLSLSYRF